MRENKKPNPPKAEGPATKEPEQSPPLSSPSGVVEAQIAFVIERLDRGEDINGDAAKYLAGWLKLALASLPQAPSTPAAAPVEEKNLCRHRYKYGECPHCETERW